MFEARMEMFRNRLVKVHRHLGRQARRQDIQCYRLYDHDLPEFPLRIDLYGLDVYVSEYKRQHGLGDEAYSLWVVRSIETISSVLDLPADRVHWKLRQRKTGHQGQYQKTGEERRFVEVQEGGLRFWVNLTDYLDTGLFLDHRLTRSMVRAAATDKRVLNLFAYTGSFSVYAADGKAAEVCTVDLSNTYLDWSKRNMELNGFTSTAFTYVQADVKSFLPSLPEGRFDLIVMDPPTFSNSQRMEELLDIQRDHVFLIRACMRVLAPEGILYFSTNFTQFQLDAEALADLEVKDLTKATTPFDFEGRLNRYCFLMKNPG